MKRVFIVFLCLMIALQPVGIAMAGFSLPGMLTTIESEAFMGMKSISGNVSLPSGVKHIGDRAFADTDVYALSLPSGVESVGAGVLDGTNAVYVEVPGFSTSLADGAFDAPLPFILGKPGSVAETWAKNNGRQFLNSSHIMREGGFAYLYPNDSFNELVLMFPDRFYSEVTRFLME